MCGLVMKNIKDIEVEKLQRSVLKLQGEYVDLKRKYYELKDALERIKSDSLSAYDCEKIAETALLKQKTFKTAF